MNIWLFSKPNKPTLTVSTIPDIPQLKASSYVAEYIAAMDRTQELGFEPPFRLLVRKNCVDMKRVQPVLLDYFAGQSPESMIGQTAAMHFALIPLLYDKTGIPFNLTIGWSVRKGKAFNGSTVKWKSEDAIVPASAAAQRISILMKAASLPAQQRKRQKSRRTLMSIPIFHRWVVARVSHGKQLFMTKLAQTPDTSSNQDKNSHVVQSSGPNLGSFGSGTIVRETGSR